MNIDDDLRFMRNHRVVRDIAVTALQGTAAVGLALLCVWWSL